MVDLSKFHNPYDFANPVSDEELFVGRKRELEEIRYYLDHAKTAPRPINIALLGPRASGKTSLLNMTDLEAKKRGFCTVRIDLDEDDAKTQLGFFYKLFDGIFSAACEFGAFGGIEGKTYDTYLDIVNTYNVPEDKTFCPFQFPLQYAKAMGSGNVDAQLSDHTYKKDLEKISSEVKKPIILLFDESDVLINSRVHLEKLRNIFMNTRGYMIVLAGTPGLFPVMNSVFSPIIRQFKKINVGEFEDIGETGECIRKPLEKIGIVPDEIFDFEDYIAVKEVHDFSGGRPYEIQLICHFLFQRVQRKQDKKMKLNLGVLEDVRRELEASQDITARPMLIKIQRATKTQLSALVLLCACDGYATFDQIWAFEYIFRGEERWTKESLNKELQYFIEEGILENREGIIKFAGDDFDKIYVKYLARERGVDVNIIGSHLELYWFVRMADFFGKILKSVNSIGEFYMPNTDHAPIDFGTKKSFENYGEGSFDLYKLMLKYRNEETIPVLQMEITFPWLKLSYWHYTENPKYSELIDNLGFGMEPLKKRANEVGGNVFIAKRELAVVPVEEITKKVEQTDNERLRNSLAGWHLERTKEEYIKRANIEEALFHANLAYRYCPNVPAYSNNLGYISMVTGDLNRAKELFKKAISGYEESYEAALPNYDLGILEAKCGNFKIALERINLCIRQLECANKKDMKCVCLIVPKLINGELGYEEVKEPNLLETAKKAKSILQSLLDRNLSNNRE